MTKKTFVLVEGPTEEAFIKQILVPALPGLWLIPTIVRTKVTGAQPEKGGLVSYHEFMRQVSLLLRDSSAKLVTTMFDYQGLGSDFPGRKEPTGSTPLARVQSVEAAMKGANDDSRYLPYLALHEFEALLFVRPAIIAEVVQDSRLKVPLQAIRAKYPASPEEINDSPATSPSARIENLCMELTGSPRIFRKRTHGPIIAGRIGLEKIRAECPHFNEWLTKLEAFAIS